MTTRKLTAHAAWAAVLCAVALGTSGCATPGPLHVYALASTHAPFIHDQGPDRSAEVPSFLTPEEKVIGLAYDPFTDHLFLRLDPGDRIRVVDRPARAIKRELVVPEFETKDSAGNLTVRPRDGHLFAAHRHDSALVECTRLGKYVGTIPLAGFGAPPVAVAIDPVTNRFLTLRVFNHTTRLYVHDQAGKLISEAGFATPITTAALAFDPERREVYAPLVDGTAIGVFSEQGEHLRTLSLPAAFLDVGPRSFLRMF